MSAPISKHFFHYLSLGWNGLPAATENSPAPVPIRLSWGSQLPTPQVDYKTNQVPHADNHEECTHDVAIFDVNRRNLFPLSYLFFKVSCSRAKSRQASTTRRKSAPLGGGEKRKPTRKRITTVLLRYRNSLPPRPGDISQSQEYHIIGRMLDISPELAPPRHMADPSTVKHHLLRR